MTPAALSAVILGCALVLFVTEKVRHDLVALLALFACLMTGLTTPARAFAGLADPAVVAVAAILVVGRAIELSGIAASIARIVIPKKAGFTVRLSALLAVGALLSAFMNNIAALVITMPIATQIARQSKRPPGATLMPLAFATILGGMTTLIGTPANLILSSVREDELGAPFDFFSMSTVGVAVAVVGLGYLSVLGWRLLPVRVVSERTGKAPWQVYELGIDHAGPTVTVAAVKHRLRAASARLLAIFHEGERLEPDGQSTLANEDRVLVLSRQSQWATADMAGLAPMQTSVATSGLVTARVVVAHGSLLIGLGHDAIQNRSGGRLSVVAVGPNTARDKAPLESVRNDLNRKGIFVGTKS